MNKDFSDNSTTKEGFTMPTLEEFYPETTEYIRDMKAYLKEILNMPEDKAKEHSMNSLINMGLFDENGEFTDQYSGSREYYKSFNKNKEG